jgi:hypothetical protein
MKSEGSGRFLLYRGGYKGLIFYFRLWEREERLNIASLLEAEFENLVWELG